MRQNPKKLIEILYGKRNKFEVKKSEGFLKTGFYVYKDGEYFGSYSALDRAVLAAKKAGKTDRTI